MRYERAFACSRFLSSNKLRRWEEDVMTRGCRTRDGNKRKEGRRERERIEQKRRDVARGDRGKYMPRAPISQET